jgi:hypothetical protein
MPFLGICRSAPTQRQRDADGEKIVIFSLMGTGRMREPPIDATHEISKDIKVHYLLYCVSWLT